MAEEDANSKVKDTPTTPPPFLEVVCKSSDKTRRFATGTNAGFAVNLINRKLDDGYPLALLIEAAKEGEEPISFGPNSVLVDYGQGWKLQTVIDQEGGLKYGASVRTSTKLDSSVLGSDGSCPKNEVSPPVLSLMYIGKILLAFVMIFVLGAIFTLALENLPRLILFINSSM